MAWGKNGTPDTLTTPTNKCEISDLTAKKFNQFMCHSFKGDGSYALDLNRYNSNSNSVYTNRTSVNGGTDNTQVSQTSNNIGNNINFDHFQMIYTISISGEEKLSILFVIDANTAGSGTAPVRRETVTKFVPSPDADITTVTMDGSSGTAGTDSNLSALGSDFTIAPPTVQDGAVFEETDTNKHYLLDDGTWTEI
jgi:hypothetical protein